MGTAAAASNPGKSQPCALTNWPKALYATAIAKLLAANGNQIARRPTRWTPSSRIVASANTGSARVTTTSSGPSRAYHCCIRCSSSGWENLAANAGPKDRAASSPRIAPSVNPHQFAAVAHTIGSWLPAHAHRTLEGIGKIMSLAKKATTMPNTKIGEYCRAVRFSIDDSNRVPNSRNGRIGIANISERTIRGRSCSRKTVSLRGPFTDQSGGRSGHAGNRLRECKRPKKSYRCGPLRWRMGHEVPSCLHCVPAKLAY